MFWDLGSWQRKTHSKCPLPEHLEKFRPRTRFDLNTEHQPIGERPLYNNYFVTAIKNIAAHLFLNCEANSIYEHGERLEESGWKTCFNDFTDLMCAARLGRDGCITQIAGYSTDDDDDDDDDDTKLRFVSWATISKSSGERHSTVQRPF